VTWDARAGAALFNAGFTYFDWLHSIHPALENS
jgi:hypothetical protein